jgi:hypothetical protein
VTAFFTALGAALRGAAFLAGVTTSAFAVVLVFMVVSSEN